MSKSEVKMKYREREILRSRNARDDRRAEAVAFIKSVVVNYLVPGIACINDDDTDGIEIPFMEVHEAWVEWKDEHEDEVPRSAAKAGRTLFYRVLREQYPVKEVLMPNKSREKRIVVDG